MLLRQANIEFSQISEIFFSSRRNLLFLILIFIWNSALFGQDSTSVYRWTPTNKGQNNEPFLLIGGDETNMYAAFKERKREVSIRSYNYESLEEELLYTFEFDAEFSRDESFIEAFYLNRKIYLFVEEFSFKEKSQKLYTHVFDIDQKKFVDKQEVDHLEKGRNNRRGDFLIALNSDSSSFVILAVDPWHKKEQKTFSARLFSIENGLVWENKFNLPYGSGYTEIKQIKADQNGNLHLGIEVSPERGASLESLQKDQSQHKFILLSYFHAEKRIKETDLNLGEKWIADMAFDLSDKGEIVVSGFYSNDRFNSIGGSFYLRLNSTDLSVQASALNPLSEKAVIDLIGEKKSNKGKEVPRVELRHIVVNPNGSCSLIGEQFWMRE
ncbi:MAG: hypothetical protein AAF487_14120, partial [Bacteroidota bacterium]